jgi:hypothetical protein
MQQTGLPIVTNYCYRLSLLLHPTNYPYCYKLLLQTIPVVTNYCYKLSLFLHPTTIPIVKNYCYKLSLLLQTIVTNWSPYCYNHAYKMATSCQVAWLIGC